MEENIQNNNQSDVSSAFSPPTKPPSSDPGRRNLKFSDLFKLSLRNFFVKPMRTSLTILGISLGIGAVLFLTSLGYGLQYVLIGKLVSTEDSLVTFDVSVPFEDSMSITQEKIDEVRRIGMVDDISPVAEFLGEVKFGDSIGLILVKVIDPANYFRFSGTIVDSGEYLEPNDDSIIISSQVVTIMGLSDAQSMLGGQAELRANRQDESEDGDEQEIASRAPLTIKGIIEDEVESPFVLVSASSLTRQPENYKKILVKAVDIDQLEPLRDKLMDFGYLISSRLDLANQAKKIMNIITIVLAVFGMTALVVSAIGMFNTMVIGFLEKIYEVGIMKSLGATDRDIQNLFLLESSLMGFVGGVGGILVGVGGGKLINFALNFLSGQLGGLPINLFITPFWFMIFILLISIFIGFISGFWPARRAAVLSPKAAFIKK